MSEQNGNRGLTPIMFNRGVLLMLLLVFIGSLYFFSLEPGSSSGAFEQSGREVLPDSRQIRSDSVDVNSLSMSDVTYRPKVEVVEGEQDYTVEIQRPRIPGANYALVLKDNALEISGQIKGQLSENSDVRMKQEAFSSYRKRLQFDKAVLNGEPGVLVKGNVVVLTIPKS